MHVMRSSLAVLSFAATALGLPAQDTKAIAAAGEVFEGRCASCHTIPDPAVATDRGWLDQVNRTA